MKWLNKVSTYRRVIPVVLMTAAVLSLTACQRSKTADNSKQTETSAPEDTTAAAVKEALTEKKAEELEGCGILRGTVTDGSDYSETIEIRTDNSNDYSVPTTDIPMEEITSIKPGQKIAIAYSGALKDGTLEGVNLIVTLNPQVQYEIKVVSGETVSNAMSTFIVKGEDGEEVSFMKDNCEIEDNALSRDSGDEVKVYYVTSVDTEINYPLKIQKKQ